MKKSGLKNSEILSPAANSELQERKKEGGKKKEYILSKGVGWNKDWCKGI